MPTVYPATLGDKLYAVLSSCTDNLIHVVLEFDGALQAALVDRALRLSLGVWPILGCRLHENFWQMSWQARSDLEKVPLLHIQRGASEADLEAYITAPADPRVEPLVQAVLLGFAQGDRLCFKFQHVVGDGRAAIEYVKLVSEIYTRLLVEPEYVPEQRSGDRGFAPIFRRYGGKQAWSVLRQTLRNLKAILMPPRNWTMALAEEQSPRFLLKRDIQPGLSQRLHQRGKSVGASVNDLLVTACLRSMSKVAPRPVGAPWRLLGAVDLRHYLKRVGRRPPDNLSTFYCLTLSDDLGASFAETLLLVCSEMKKIKARYLGVADLPSIVLPLLLPQGLSTWISRKLVRPDSQWIPPVLTNIHCHERYQFGELAPPRVWGTAPLATPPFLRISVTGCAQSLSINILSSGGCQNRDRLALLLDLMVDELTQFGGS